MKPRGPLMIEHRLIEKMLKIVEKEADKIAKGDSVDPLFIDTTVDFIRTYADRTHHGKEEDILFRDLETKEMTKKDDKMMQELIDEHKYARKTVVELVDAKNNYVQGKKEALRIILEKLRSLIRFYPEHIMKEDKEFFPNTERCFSEDELDKMLEEFWEFDRNMIHEKYKKVVSDLQKILH
jgi:hemerythrin-like domain-containing protein